MTALHKVDYKAVGLERFGRRVAPLPLSDSPLPQLPSPPLGDPKCRRVGPRFVPNSCLLLRACVLLNENKSDAYCDA